MFNNRIRLFASVSRRELMSRLLVSLILLVVVALGPGREAVVSYHAWAVKCTEGQMSSNNALDALEAIKQRMKVRASSSPGDNRAATMRWYEIYLRELFQMQRAGYNPAFLGLDQTSQTARAFSEGQVDYIEEDVWLRFGCNELTYLREFREGIRKEYFPVVTWSNAQPIVQRGVFWYFMLALVTLACLVLRVFIVVPGFRPKLATLWNEWQTICVASLFWFVGLGAYQPGKRFPDEIAATAARLAELRLRSRVKIHSGSLPEIRYTAVERLAFVPALVATWRALWGDGFKWGWAVLQIWRTPVRRALSKAVFLTILTPFVLLTEVVCCQAAWAADDSASKPKEPTFLTPTGLIWVYAQDPLAPESPPGEHLFFLFKGGDLAVYNITSNAPTYEVAPRPISWTWGDAKGTLGGFFSYATATQAFTRYGLEATFAAKLFGGKAMLKGPLYGYTTQEGTYGLFSPNARLHVPVTEHLAIGAAATAGIESTIGSSVLFGPSIEYTRGNTTTQLRGGQWLCGPNQGNWQIRADFTVRFAR